MRLSSKTDTALRTVVDLALNRGDGVIRAAIIAERQGISRDYLGQILLALKSAGIVRSKRGVDGGYLLVPDPADIKLLSIVELTDPSMLGSPTGDDGEEVSPEKAVIRDLWTDMTGRIAADLDRITVKDLCDLVTELQGRQARDYAI